MVEKVGLILAYKLKRTKPYVDLHVTLLASQHQFEATPIESYIFELVELSTLGG